MEVHHHPTVEKKSFKAYLLEGLMIFLAVTMGFFAETIREGIHERHQAEKFATSLLKDLESDTATLTPFIGYYKIATAQTDTLFQLLEASDPQKIPTAKLYWYGLFGGAYRSFTSNNATFEQMKNAGALSYLDKGVAEDLARYDMLYRQMQAWEEKTREIFTQVRVSRSRLFDFRYNEIANDIFQKGDSPLRIDSFLRNTPPLLSFDRVSFNEYVELVRSRRLGNYIVQGQALLDQANKLIVELREAYDL